MPAHPATQRPVPAGADRRAEPRDRRHDGRTACVAVRLPRRPAGSQRSANGDTVRTARQAAPLTILFGTESGNAEALAAQARKAAARLGFAAKVVDMADITPAQAAETENLLIVATTWGEGDPPQRAQDFYEALMADDCAALRQDPLCRAGPGRSRLCPVLRNRPPHRRTPRRPRWRPDRRPDRVRPRLRNPGHRLDRRRRWTG